MTEQTELTRLRAENADLKAAFRVLAALVREEYPADHKLSEIAAIWGTNRSASDLEALRRVEAMSGERSNALNHE